LRGLRFTRLQVQVGLHLGQVFWQEDHCTGNASSGGEPIMKPDRRVRVLGRRPSGLCVVMFALLVLIVDHVGGRAGQVVDQPDEGGSQVGRITIVGGDPLILVVLNTTDGGTVVKIDSKDGRRKDLTQLLLDLPDGLRLPKEKKAIELELKDGKRPAHKFSYSGEVSLARLKGDITVILHDPAADKTGPDR
jgi:hypothetical protein